MKKTLLILISATLFLAGQVTAIDLNSSRALQYYGAANTDGNLDFQVNTDSTVDVYGNTDMNGNNINSINKIRLRNTESVSNGQIARDDSIGFLAEWNNHGNAVLWDSYNVQGGNAISISGGKGQESNPSIAVNEGGISHDNIGGVSYNDHHGVGSGIRWDGSNNIALNANDLDSSGDLSGGVVTNTELSNSGSFTMGDLSVTGSAGNDITVAPSTGVPVVAFNNPNAGLIEIDYQQNVHSSNNHWLALATGNGDDETGSGVSVAYDDSSIIPNQNSGDLGKSDQKWDNIYASGTLSVGGTECPDDEALLGDGTCGSIGGGGSTQNLSEVLAAGNVANQTIEFSNGIEIGDSSTSVGSNTDAVAVGNSANASGYRASAFGPYAEANGTYASTFGYDASATGFYASAFGFFADASTTQALAVGPGASASGNSASAFGPVADASAEGAVAIGHKANAPNQYEATFGNLGNQKLDVNVTGNVTAHDELHFPNGIEIGNGTDIIYEYGVKTFDISTAAFQTSISTQDSSPTGLAWNNDGTKLYVIGRIDDSIYEYDVSTPFDITTASFQTSINTQDPKPEGLAWNNDGTKLYEIGRSGDSIYEYDVSTEFDISTASFQTSISTQDSEPEGLAWNNDGTKLYEIGSNGDSIYEYDVSTPFDISTASFQTSISTQDSGPSGLAWNNDGTKLYEIGYAGDSIYEYDVSDRRTALRGGKVEIPNGNLDMNNNDINNVGTLNANTKNFVQQVNESHEVVYTSQESPDVRAVVEDTAEVVNGTAVVELPDHFSKTVSDKKSELKVQVTPNSVNTYGLAVTNRSDNQIAVKELMGGSHSFKFDYRVTGIREGYENKTVVREIEKSENAASAPAT